MTTLTHAVRPTRSAEPPSLRRADRAALVLSPLLMLGGGLLHPQESSDGAVQLATVAASPDRWRVSHLLLVLAAVVVVPAALALGRLLAARSRRWATTGTVLAVGGTCLLVGVFALEGFGASALADLPDRVAAGQALESLGDEALFPFALLSLGFEIGLSVLGAGLLRLRVGAPFAALALLVGGITMAVGMVAELDVPSVIGLALLAVGQIGTAVTADRR